MSLYSRLHPTAAEPTYCGADPSRCVRVHVGRIDRLGYLYCVPCADRLSIAGDPVHMDAGPHSAEDCESCGRGITRSDLTAPTLTDGYCGAHGARMPHYAADGTACAPDSPDAQRAYREAAPTLSPFTRRALARELPSKDLTRGR